MSARRTRMRPSIEEVRRRDQVVAKTMARIGAKKLSMKDAAKEIGIGYGTLINAVGDQVGASEEAVIKFEKWLNSSDIIQSQHKATIYPNPCPICNGDHLAKNCQHPSA